MNTIARTSFALLATACLITTTAVAQSDTSTIAKPTAPPATIKPAATGAMEHSHETVEYKDPEDMTTRNRPGNNKTSRMESPTATTSTAGQPASEADAKKHIANIKWQDKTVTFPACDGASKDAAKCAAAPATGKTAASGAAAKKP